MGRGPTPSQALDHSLSSILSWDRLLQIPYGDYGILVFLSRKPTFYYELGYILRGRGMCKGLHMCENTHGGQRSALVFTLHYTLSFEIRSLTGLEFTKEARLTGHESWRSSSFSFLSAWITGTSLCLSLCEFWELKLSPHACVRSTLLTEPFPVSVCALIDHFWRTKCTFAGHLDDMQLGPRGHILVLISPTSCTVSTVESLISYTHHHQHPVD